MAFAHHPRAQHRLRKALRQTRLALEDLENRWLPSSGLAAYAHLPLSFEPNVGQSAAGVDFLSRGSGYSLLLRPGDASLALHGAGAALEMRLVGANLPANAVGMDRLPGVSSYLVGNDPSQWRTNIPTYGEVAYRNILPGIDLNYHGTQGQLEYDFVVNPGASPGAIRLALAGVQSWSLDGLGDLILHTASGDVVQHAPSVYQQIDGSRHAVTARYVLENDDQVGFAVSAYDASSPLVIDPTLTYGDTLGGTGSDFVRTMAVDSSGAAYIAGSTGSADFPTNSPSQGVFGGNQDAFVTKLNASGTALVYSTYLGGTAAEQAYGIAVDAQGDAYVAGATNSTDFPTTAGAFQRAIGSNLGGDAFVAKLNASGNALIYSTYLGGSSDDAAFAIAIDGTGNAYVAGSAASTDFPTAAAIQATKTGTAPDAFLTKLNPSGSALVYSTYLGGSNNDSAVGVAVDAAGDAYIGGYTSSSDFPTVNAIQAHHKSDNGSRDVFVAKVNAAGSQLLYSTYLGGTGDDVALALGIDPAGDVYVAGGTSSTDYPTLNAAQPTLVGNGGTFVTKLNPQGGLAYSTYWGGDEGSAIAVDAAGDAYVSGSTSATNFPTVNPVQARLGGNVDAFLMKLNSVGGVTFSSYLGGNLSDQALAVAVDSFGNAYLGGSTNSVNFPGVGAFGPGGSGDAFVAKITFHTWQAIDIAAGGDGKTRLLWDNVNGQSEAWNVTNSFQVTAGPASGPYSGWTGKATAAGSDGLTRILWTNADGSAAVWLERSDGMLANSRIFGPITGWSAQDITVGSDGSTRILWTNTGGQAVVWSLDANLNVTSGPVFGPFAGWTATHLAAGSDGHLRLLWTNTNGAAALWVLNADGTLNSSSSYGAIAGWTATDIAVATDNTTRVLWTNTSGAVAVWTVNGSFAVTSAAIYGPFLGYSASRIAIGSDDLIHLLWTAVDGTTVLWLVDANGNFLQAGSFGPL